MAELIRTTRSVCPVCLKPVKAALNRREGAVYMDKHCPDHGGFSVPVWRDKANLEQWRGGIPEIGDQEAPDCPHGCGVCGGHLQGVCCVLLEVTGRCNLKCAYCFADPGGSPEPGLPELKRALEDILGGGDKPLIQFSGGEPTLRDDLPELVAYSRRLGCKYTQLNSNGLRLARDEAYVKALAEAGLSFVFLQFDGIGDEVYRRLRGAPVYGDKLAAIRMCDRYRIGVTLVPTVVRGVNDDQIGDIVRFGVSLSPAVRGVHFQPVSYFGRYPARPPDEARYTLDELADAIGMQAGVPAQALFPSRCDHPLCGFHGSFLADGEALIPLSRAGGETEVAAASAERNREYVGRRWSRAPEDEEEGKRGCCGEEEEGCCGEEEDGGECCGEEDEEGCCCGEDMETFDGFLRGVRKHGFTLTAMAFQDAMNLDAERLRHCSLHMYHEGVQKPFCARYLTPMKG